ncbi:DUF3592 domain-containing protein [Haloarcula laminariae]|uniref:DUF3592 domain-containing protein n=1 Tax=Haloarcula laminariae TaxID=2961577 RepID=UPI00240712D7|nr:DUF3592 domain-containing protein [Halomicroarcula sp. FL173]
MGVEINGPSGTFRILLTVVIGFGAIGYGGYSYTSQTSALDSAVTVNATIVSTSVETVSQRRGTEYRPQATFNYTYNRKAYTTTNVYPGPLSREFGSPEEASAQLDGFESGTTVTAYVPPDSPNDAFLKVERSNKPFLLAGFGVLLVLGALASALRD